MDTKHNITIHMNKMLYLEFLVFYILLTAIYLFVFVEDYKYSEVFFDDTARIVTFVVFALSPICIYVLGAPTICAKIVVTKEGAILKRPFRKSIYHPWEFYTNCDKGYYLYYGMPSYYIVLSNFKLRTDELCHINRMEMNDRCIRIKYNKKNFNALMQMLPPKLSASLENQFKDIKAPKVNLIP